VCWDGSHWHLSFSPELFFALKDGLATVRPMKGTAPRGETPGQDEAFRAGLAGNAKDRAENLMIVDLMRNDLSRVAVPGSVRVEEPFAIESYPTVHQMVTTVRARLTLARMRANWCGRSSRAARSPARPRSRDGTDRRGRTRCARALLWRVRPDRPSGDAAFNVAIRTVRLDPRTDRAVMGVGSAVVADPRCWANGGNAW
jgi:para-aminobenzoate synthetase/4-amino-4-deoxychorismate lyase